MLDEYNMLFLGRRQRLRHLKYANVDNNGRCQRSGHKSSIAKAALREHAEQIKKVSARLKANTLGMRVADNR